MSEKLLKAIAANPWLITQGAFDQIIEIANRENVLTPEQISQFAAQPFDAEGMVEMYDDTAVVSINGPIFRYANLFTRFSGATSTEVLSSKLAEVDADDSVKRVINRFDTPGGMANGASEMSSQIANMQTPVVTFATGSMCSLGYFWGSQAPVIVAEDSIIGCIGTRAPGIDDDEDNVLVSKHAPAKIMNNEAIQNVINRLEDVFHKHVSQGRGVSVEYVIEHFGQGGVFVGTDAVDAGLADDVGTLDSILGGNHASVFATRKRVIPSSQSMETNMSGDNKDGGVTAAEHAQGVKDAEAAGKQAGLSEARAETETAVIAENDRCVAILKAGEGKPSASVMPLIEDRGITAETAVKVLAGVADEDKSSLNSQMDGSDPVITNGDGASGDGDGPSQDDINSSWAKASSGGA